MAIPPDELSRGCSAFLPQPVGAEGIRQAEVLVQALLHYNNEHVVFRSSDSEDDIHRHVFRWDTRIPEHVFAHGFQPLPQGDTPDSTYFDIDNYVRNTGQTGVPRTPYAFVSTTFNSGYVPQTPSLVNQVMYRYEIYAPGGVWVSQTVRNYPFPTQDEVLFPGGIARQYIRSAQRFRLLDAGGGRVRRERLDDQLYMNPHIDPASHPERRLLSIRNPVDYYVVEGRREPLNVTYPELPERRLEKRSVSMENDDTTATPTANAIWYADKVTDIDSNLNAGFRSYYTGEVYLFLRNEYVLIDYAPGTTGDKILSGPRLITEGFPSLANTPFAAYGLDCAFGNNYNMKEAYIFTSNLCAHINFAPRTTDDYIIKGPITIAEMFPFFKGTGFDKGLDAAFEASAYYEAYVFKGDRYALINYNEPRLIGGPKKITDGFKSLKGTIFESGIEAAFASHTSKEAFLFKGDQYALINFAPGTSDDYIIGGPKKITPNWPSLAKLLPHKNHGPDGPNNS